MGKQYRLNKRTYQYEEVPPIPETVDEILQQFGKYKFEFVCGNLFERNVFVLFGKTITYHTITIKALCNRIRKFFIWLRNFTKYTYYSIKKREFTKEDKISITYKEYKTNWLKYIHEKSLQNFWKMFGIAWFLTGFAISKLVYDISIILTWIYVHIIRPLLKWAVVIATILISVFAISGAGKDQKNNNN